MQAPKILPRIAHKAGISEELALKLWRRAASEAECLCGKADGAEYGAWPSTAFWRSSSRKPVALRLPT